MSFAHDSAFDARRFDRHDFTNGSTSWPEPDLTLLGTNRRPAPPFPVQTLGEFWGQWAARSAEASSAPVDYAAVALLAAAGATLANVRRPVAGAGWSEPPLLWVGLVGSPSTGKSPSMDAALDLVGYAEDQLAAGFEDVRRDYEATKQSAKAYRDAWDTSVREAVKNKAAIPPMPSNAEEPEPPVRPRIRIGDATTEKQAALAAALPKGQLIVRDELAGWLGQFDRYGGGGSDRAFALESYGGRSYRVDRMKNPEPISIRHLSIGVLGSIQPDKITVLTKADDDGLASRILWTWPEALPAFRLAREARDDMPAKYAFSRLVGLEMAQDRFGNAEPRLLPLTTEAEDTLEQFGQEMAEKAEHATGIFASAIGKARGQALRLSAVLTYLHWSATTGKPEPTTISHGAVVRACGLLEYFIAMAERTYGDAAVPAHERGAMSLARYLRREKAKTFNAREVSRSLGGSLRAAEAMDAACAVLVDAGMIRPVDGDRGRGRPRKDYVVHPAVYARA